MYMTLEDRRKLQAVLENALCESASNGILTCDIPVKNIYLLLLSLIYELNDKDTPAKQDSDEFPCFCHRIQEILTDISSLKIPDSLCFEYVQQFTSLAHNLGHLSTEINRLLELLHREYSDRVLGAVLDDRIKQ